ncbi:MAG TPA: efflux RND transporter permease subunit [Caulobacteraceae bacterium]|jgi:HAE1 family hydrophobic/amphiphilic exporter-1|nr:efflux RND transporter permease subunit [Caulobacteraceae bacterium]
MNLSAPFITRPVMTWLVMIAIVVAGLFAYVTLPVSELPNVDFPTISVQGILPGANPQTVAASVATPLENAFASIPGLDSMTSTSSQGVTNIVLQFRLDRNIDGAAQDVQSAISSVLRRLPRAMPNPPTYRKVNPTAPPIFLISLYSDTVPISKVDQYARNFLATRLSTVNGVAQVNIWGSARYAVRIQADPAALAARQMSLQDLINAAGSTNSSQPSGSLNGPSQTSMIDSDGQLTNAAAFRRQIIAYRNGAPVTFGDVAKVVDSFENVRQIDWLNDQRAVSIAVQRQPDSNTTAIVRDIRQVLPQFLSQLPAGIKAKVFYDRSQSIRASIDDVQKTLLIAAGLVVAIIFVFLRRLGATLIPSLALPISTLGAFAGMALFRFSLDNLSLMALTLSVGFVVDDAIVMLENIVRHIENGETPLEAALKGSREIGFTILSITVSLAAVFIPVLFMGGVVGRLLHEFAVTIVAAIFVSGFVSVTLTPMLCARVLRHQDREREAPWLQKIDAGFDAVQAAYRRSLDWSLKHHRLIFGSFIASLALSYALFAVMPQSFLPSDDYSLLTGAVQTSTRSSYDQTTWYVRQVVKIIERDPNVEDVQADEGGDMTISLKPVGARRLTADEVADELRHKLRDIAGTNVTISNPPTIRVGARGSRSTYQYTLQGLDFAELQRASKQLIAALKEDPTFVGVNSDQDEVTPAVHVDINRERAAALGVTPDQIETALGAAFGGEQVSQIYAATDQYQVVLELLPEYQADASGLSRLYLTSNSGSMVPLSAVTDSSRSTMPPTINHSGQLPSITLSFDLAPGKALSDAVTAVKAATDRVGLPDTVSGGFAGTASAFQQSSSDMGVLLLVATFVVYVVLGILYESFIHPLTILSGLPAAALGALVALYLTKIPLTIYAFVGMIMLIGIVKKNAIMMIDFALARMRADPSTTPEGAIYDAAIVRFRPIMMTTLAALMGTLPIAFGVGMGADSRRPLGICVAGGLIFSQVLTLYITPVIFIYLERAKASALDLWNRTARQEAA